MAIRVSVITTRDSDPEEVERALFTAAYAHPGISAHPAPETLFTSLSPSSLTFELTAWTAPGTGNDPPDKNLTQSVRVELILASIEIIDVSPINGKKTRPWTGSA